jgi:3-phenylpropionate/cinnamic acid dioxygenase small subunit
MNAIDFISAEAALLDDRRYEEWAELFTTDCRYWAPYDWNSEEPRTALNIIYDDQKRLQDRVSRLTGGDMHSQDPPSQTVRLLGHPVQLESPSWNPVGDVDEVWTMPFRLSELRREQLSEFAGRYTYWLRREDGEYRIVAKKAQLLGAETPLSNLTFPL